MMTAVVPAVGLCPPIVGCAALEGLGGSLTGDAASTVFSALSSWLATGGVALVDHVLGLLTTTTPSLATGSGSAGSSWFAKEEDFMLGLMGLVILPMLLAATVGAIARQDLSRLGRTWFVALPVSIVSALVGVEVTRGALAVTDSLSSAVLSTVNVPGLIGEALGVIVAGDGGNMAGGSVAILFIASLAIVAAILLWLELVVRGAAIYVALLFLPLALSGLVWPSTSHMARRLVQLLAALIVSKFVIAAVLALGAGAVAGGGEDGALAGVAILLLAGFAPFALLRMAPVVEAGALAHLEGLSRRPFEGARRSASLAGSGLGLIPEPVRSTLGLGGNRGEPSVGPSMVGAAGVRQQEGEYREAESGIGGTNIIGSSPPDAGGAAREGLGQVPSPPPSGGTDRWGTPAGATAPASAPEDDRIVVTGSPQRGGRAAQGEDR
jgi:hypothetical protein